ncbi:MAG TPA: hypothetical protein DIW23_01000, partial [Anaerolineae bacterium]|nr:hypothetical protein [Anaerolineae bacterium]
IGLLGRYLGFSFDTVKFLFFLIGLVFILTLLNRSIIEFSETITSVRNLFSNPVLIFTICLAFALTISDLLFFIDDLTYLSYLTNWQYSEQLGFQNIIHEPVVIELERFWLAMYPMGQAILSELSGVPGILLFSHYLELLLVPLAVCTAYWFARQLGFSRNAAAVSTLFQISLYAWLIGDEWPVGTWFYQSMAEDKVSAVFLLAPVFFAYVIKYIELVSGKYLFFAFLSGLAITLTHPVSLFFTCVIALWLGLLSFFYRKANLKQLITIAILVFALMLPYLLIRLIDVSSQVGFVVGTAQSGGGAFQIDRYTNVVSDIFYGLNPNMLLFIDLELGGVFSAFRFTPVVIGLLSLLFSFINLKKERIYCYVFCASLLVLLVTIPYTGWIFGYFTDARLIYRASWFVPLGLGSVVILQYFSSSIKKLQVYSKRNNLIMFVCFLFTLPVFAFMNVPRIPAFFAVLDRSIQLAKIGSVIDSKSQNQVVSIGLDYFETMLLPGVSAKTTLISFREEKLDNGHNHYLTEEEIEERIYASNAIRSLDNDDMTSIERCKYINEYEVKFVIANIKDANLYMSLVQKCGITIEQIFQTEDKALLQIQLSP